MLPGETQCYRSPPPPQKQVFSDPNHLTCTNSEYSILELAPVVEQESSNTRPLLATSYKFSIQSCMKYINGLLVKAACLPTIITKKAGRSTWTQACKSQSGEWVASGSLGLKEVPHKTMSKKDAKFIEVIKKKNLTRPWAVIPGSDGKLAGSEQMYADLQSSHGGETPRDSNQEAMSPEPRSSQPHTGTKLKRHQGTPHQASYQDMSPVCRWNMSS